MHEAFIALATAIIYWRRLIRLIAVSGVLA